MLGSVLKVKDKLLLNILTGKKTNISTCKAREEPEDTKAGRSAFGKENYLSKGTF